MQRSNYCSPDDSLALEDEHGRINVVLAPSCFIHIPGSAAPSAESVTAAAVAAATASLASAAGGTKIGAAAAAASSSASGGVEVTLGGGSCQGRIIRPDDLVSGIVLAVHGMENEMGDFVASRIFFPEPVPQQHNEDKGAAGGKRKAASSASAAAAAAGAGSDSVGASVFPRPGATYTVFVSDLQVGAPEAQTAPVAASATGDGSAPAGATSSASREALLDLLCDMITGLAGSPIDAAAMSQVRNDTSASCHSAHRSSPSRLLPARIV